jgi:hypothetical protein
MCLSLNNITSTTKQTIKSSVFIISHHSLYFTFYFICHHFLDFTLCSVLSFCQSIAISSIIQSYFSLALSASVLTLFYSCSHFQNERIKSLFLFLHFPLSSCSFVFIFVSLIQHWFFVSFDCFIFFFSDLSLSTFWPWSLPNHLFLVFSLLLEFPTSFLDHRSETIKH